MFTRGADSGHHRNMVSGPGQGRDEGVSCDAGSADQYPVNPSHPAVSHLPHPALLVGAWRAGHQLHSLSRHVSVNDVVSPHHVVHQDPPELLLVLHLLRVESQLSHLSAHRPGLNNNGQN